MFVVDICRRSLGNKRAFLNFVNKTSVTVGTQKKSDNASEKSSENFKKESEKDDKKKRRSKLYTIPKNEDAEIQAKIKIQNLLERAERAFGPELSGTEDKTDANIPRPPNKRRERYEKKEISFFRNSFDHKFINSAKKAAKELGGDVLQTEKDLIETLKSFGTKKASSEFYKMKNLSERNFTKEDIKAASKIHEIVSDINKVDKERTKKNNLMYEDELSTIDDQGLGIFDEGYKWEEDVKLLLWDELAKQELKNLVTHPPRNYYEEMILWTEQGKLWHFPIDNEQGMDEEAKISFSEHVFLEDKLDPWCPKKGPLRHFMELVCVGLSKNPYLSVSEKHEHIYWFRDYFEGKRKLLTEINAFPKEQEEKKENL